MRLFQILFFVLFLLIFPLSNILAISQENNADITLLKNAIAALQSSRPDLAVALTDYVKRQEDILEINGEERAQITDSETKKVKDVATLFGNGLVSRNNEVLEKILYSDPDAIFDRREREAKKMVEIYHNKSNNHDLMNFEIVSVKFNEDFTQAGVRIKGFFHTKDNFSQGRMEGWVFRKDKPDDEWSFDAVAFSSGDKGQKRQNNNFNQREKEEDQP